MYLSVFFISSGVGLFYQISMPNMRMHEIASCTSSCGVLFYETSQTPKHQISHYLWDFSGPGELHFGTLRVPDNSGNCRGESSDPRLVPIQYLRPSLGPGTKKLASKKNRARKTIYQFYYT